MVTGDKFMWTLVRPDGTGFAEFSHYVLEELAAAAGGLVRDTTDVRVTVQEPTAFSGALVRVGDTDRRVDALLHVTSSASYVPTDSVNAVLSANVGHVQGWRVHPTIIHDTSETVAIGERQPFKNLVWINQRLDGVTPEFYDHHWYLHAGHPDGKEAETDESRVYRARMEAAEPGQWYVQNRVLEPITPTAWVVNGFADILGHSVEGNAFIPIVPERYRRPDDQNPLGEQPFDRWPPRLVQGYSYRVA